MGLTIIDNSKNVTLSLSADDVGSLEEIKKRIDDFASFVSENDTFRITVDLVLRTSSVPGLRANASLLELLDAFEAHFKNTRRMCEELSISRSTWYSWRNGKPLRRSSWQQLIEKAPTEGLKATAQKLRDAIA